jgi:hypothetical protein
MRASGGSRPSAWARYLAEPNPGVEAVLDDVGGAVLETDIELDIRILDQKAGERAFGEEALGDRRDVEPQDAGRAALPLVQRLERRPQLGKRGRERAVQVVTHPR